MLKTILLLLPLTSLLFLAGCNEGYESASSRPSSSTKNQTQAPVQPSPASTTAAAPQSTSVRSRVSTTQPLPSGYGYVNERELVSMTRQ
ncbi:MAG: hypothetical protein LBE84_05945 [Planctomycetota bacterium]|jgi:PBP1b-binding outer membrane lipoprotein LpoB|nr:hypothetical protein [Planctomycetota bacterium]